VLILHEHVIHNEEMGVIGLITVWNALKIVKFVPVVYSFEHATIRIDREKSAVFDIIRTDKS